MPKTELKPTTKEEREQWNKDYAIYDGVWTYPHQNVIKRLCAHVERLEDALERLRLAAHHAAIDNRFGDAATRYLYAIEREAAEALNADED